MARIEIADYEKFLFLPQILLKSSAAEALENVRIWERVRMLQSIYVPSREKTNIVDTALSIDLDQPKHA